VSPVKKPRSPAGLDLRVKAKKALPFRFVLDQLEALPVVTRQMFGCVAVYVGEKVVLMLRDKPKDPKDNGVWIATTADHHETLLREFPHLRPIGLLGGKITGWQNIPADAPDFEEAAQRACELVLAGDSRIGKIPKRQQKKQRISG
jgi:hypothetical protein